MSKIIHNPLFSGCILAFFLSSNQKYKVQIMEQTHTTLNCSYRWTHTNFSTFHAIQILTMIVKNLM
jgi:hypothetical protein